MSRTKKVEKKIEGEKWEKTIEKAYQKAKSKIKIDGFRKGKAPKQIFIKKYGKDALLKDAADIALEDAYTDIIKEEKEIIKELIAYPDIQIKSIDEKALILEFEFTLRPIVKLGKYKGLNVKKEKAKVTKDEISKIVDEMRQRYVESVLKEGKIAKGDTAIIDFEGFVDGKPFEGGKSENYPLSIGSNTFIPGFEDQLIGLKAGDKKDVKVTFPKDYQADNLKGKDAVFKVTVHEVKEMIVPELNEEFFADLDIEGVNSKETLEAEISDNLLKHKETEIENKYLDALLEEAAKDMKVDIPDIMIKEELDRMIHEYEQNLKNQGLTIDMYYQFTNTSEESLKEQMKEEATRRIKYRLMLEEIAKEEKIEISDKQADEQAEEYAEKYQITKEEFINMLGGIDMVKYDIKMRKAMEIIKGEEK